MDLGALKVFSATMRKEANFIQPMVAAAQRGAQALGRGALMGAQRVGLGGVATNAMNAGVQHALPGATRSLAQAGQTFGRQQAVDLAASRVHQAIGAGVAGAGVLGAGALGAGYMAGRQ